MIPIFPTGKYVFFPYTVFFKTELYVKGLENSTTIHKTNNRFLVSIINV